jgi:alkylation response protein AidB-like acyl-CoA dehydrogenase
MSDFSDMYRLSEEHETIRAAVRELCEEKVAPNAAEADELAEFPKASFEALVTADFHAPHIPEAYSGVGADALATVIVIEEIARVCAATSLIPASTSWPPCRGCLLGRRRSSRRICPRSPGATRWRPIAYPSRTLVSDAVSMQTRAVRDGDHFVLNGVKRWITNAGLSDFYTVFVVTDPDASSKGISAFVVEKSDEGVSFGAPEKKLGIKGSPTCEVYLDRVRIPESRMIGPEGTGFELAMRTLDHTESPSPRRPWDRSRCPRLCARLRQGAQAVWQGLAEFQGLQFMIADMGMKLEAARQLSYAAAAKSERGDPDLPSSERPRSALLSDVRHGDHY